MTNPVKERDDPVACRECGRMTWSASGLCFACRSHPLSSTIELEEGLQAPPVQGPSPPSEDAFVREIRLDDAGRIDEDLSCRSCGYNLRGISPEDHCPECGIAAANSIRSDLLQFCDPRWVRRLSQGMIWIAAGCIAGFLGGIASTLLLWLTLRRFGTTSPAPMILAMLVSAATSAIFVIGVWLTTTPDPGQYRMSDRSPRVGSPATASWQ